MKIFTVHNFLKSKGLTKNSKSELEYKLAKEWFWQFINKNNNIKYIDYETYCKIVVNYLGI